jgi:hypothetical protein
VTDGRPRFPKGETRKTAKARRKRQERAVVQEVRPQVVDRDGYCRFYYLNDATRRACWGIVGECSGPSEWSHYNATHRRSKTVGMEPEQRHDRRYSMMLCRSHSHAYDQNEIDIRTLTDEGCDGPLRAERDGVVWIEKR